MFPVLRIVITGLVLLALTGQSVTAAAMTCSMMDSQKSGAAHEQAGSHGEHIGHEMVTQSDSPAESKGCCGNAMCDMAQCATPLVFPLDAATSASLNSPHILTIEYLSTYSGIDQRSIFRPPIFL